MGTRSRPDAAAQVFEGLLRHFGPQGWWPVTNPGEKAPVYSRRFTREGLSPAQQFEVAVGAILTQNTAWTNVARALERLHSAKALSVGAIGRMPLPKLYKLIRSSGYFRQKARRLKNLARFLSVHWGGRLDRFLDRPTETVRPQLLALNGVGPETADSILLYAGRHPVFVVDAYTRRIGRRLGIFSTQDYDEVQRYFMTRLRPSLPLYREYHALLVALGKEFCRPEPLCPSCPLAARCGTSLSDGALSSRCGRGRGKTS